MIGPFGARSSGVRGRAGRIKEWMTLEFGLEEGTPMSVAELRCSEPGCPPVETNVVILDGQAQQYRLHKPMVEVRYEDIEHLAAGSKTT